MLTEDKWKLFLRHDLKYKKLPFHRLTFRTSARVFGTTVAQAPGLGATRPAVQPLPLQVWTAVLLLIVLYMGAIFVVQMVMEDSSVFGEDEESVP